MTNTQKKQEKMGLIVATNTNMLHKGCNFINCIHPAKVIDILKTVKKKFKNMVVTTKTDIYYTALNVCLPFSMF